MLLVLRADEILPVVKCSWHIPCIQCGYQLSDITWFGSRWIWSLEVTLTGRPVSLMNLERGIFDLGIIYSDPWHFKVDPMMFTWRSVSLFQRGCKVDLPVRAQDQLVFPPSLLSLSASHGFKTGFVLVNKTNKTTWAILLTRWHRPQTPGFTVCPNSRNKQHLNPRNEVPLYC